MERLVLVAGLASALVQAWMIVRFLRAKTVGNPLPTLAVSCLTGALWGIWVYLQW